LVNNEKKNKVAERLKFEKKIKELEEEKIQVAKRNEEIVAEMPEIEQKSKVSQEKRAEIQA